MAHYTRWFIYAGLTYLLLAMVLGLGLWFQVALPLAVWPAFVRLLLGGWIAMFIYAVNYYTVPVFSRRDFASDRPIWAHFILANLGIAGVVLSILVGWSPGLVVFGIVEIAGAITFVYNIVSIFRTGQPRRASSGDGFLLSAEGRGPDKTATQFTQVSVLYLVAAYALGPLLVIWPFGSGQMDLVQTHLALLGWTMMMIYGVSYHILSRFTGRPIRSDRLAIWHFRLANLGLLGMALGLATELRPLLAAFGVLEAISIYLYAYNLWPTLATAKPVASTALISSEMIINDVIRRYPQTIPVFNEYNVDACCGGGQPIAVTAKADGVDLALLLDALNTAVKETN